MKRSLILSIIAIMLLVPALAWATGVSESEDNRLVLWSAASEAEANALGEAFSRNNPGVEVDIIRAGSGELLTRLQAEQPNPGGDVLVGIAKEAFDGNYDFFVPYRSANHNEIPANLRDSADPPRYYGYSMPLQAFIVNTDLLSPDEYPRSWADLTDDRYQGEIILANPALSGSAYAQVFMMNTLYGFEFLEQIADQATFVASSGAVPESVARGEFAIGVTGEGNIAQRILEGAPVAAVYPSEGTGARFDASGIIAGGPNPELAQAFIDFLTTEEAYQIIIDVQSRRVVHPAFPGPGPLPGLSDITLMEYDAAEAARIREDLTTRFSDLIE
jgi:iron(III) transport system substrate-binding protein